MFFNSKFRGRIFQVVEALDYGDAVSNQVVALDLMLKEIGFTTSIYSKWHDPKVEMLRSNLEDLDPTDEDIVIVHYAGYSDHIIPYVQELRCTKICIYHNITPHYFFQLGTDLYKFCLKGREQLKELVREFQYFWGVSTYNIRELIELGADPKNCSLVPIIVGKQPVDNHLKDAVSREKGAWLFLGRIAGNKGHVDLVKLFAKARKIDPSCASKLYIVGNHNPADSYFKELIQQIEILGISSQVTLTGKVSDAEVEYYLDTASVYVSMSQHEGFGVPLIEAAYHSLPVVALRSSAVGETLGEGSSLADTPDDMLQIIQKLLSSDDLYQKTVEEQKRNAMRFSAAAVNKQLIDALQKFLPDSHRFNSVSVVICTYNRSDLLDRCLDYLQYQTNQNFEVIVVNGPSTDNTQEILSKYKDKIKIAHNPKRNLSISRNIGIELSDGDLIAFIDDDALPFDDWVETLISEFNERPLTHAAIGGPAYYAGTLEFQAQDIGINKFAIDKVNIDSSDIGTNGWERSMLGTNTCFRADIIREVRGFDEQFDYFLDESELSFRLQKNNYIVGYSPNLFLRHEFAQSDNRGGKYKFNWFSICKNTAYFIAAYSGLKNKELSEYIDQRMNSDRIAPIEQGFNAGKISRKESDEFIEAIKSGAKQGLSDAAKFPRTRELAPAPGMFRVFTCAANYPIIGRDLRSLHICIVTKEFPPFLSGGGIGTLYYHLASELLLMGHHVTVIVPGDFKSTHQQGRFSIRYEPVHTACADTFGAPGFTNNLNWSISAFHAVAEIHKKHPVDIVDSALWDSETLALSLIPREKRPPLVLRLVTPFPVAARINGWSLSKRENDFFIAAEKAVIQNADAVVPISESIADTIENEHKIRRDARWKKSYCGIAYWPSFDVSSDYTELKLINDLPFVVPKNSKLILFLGRLESRKGVDLLLAAADEFLSADPQAQLLLAGKDVEGWSTRTSLSSGILERVHFVGEVDDSTREKLLNAAYCVVFPSRYESFGLVPLEAFVHGTPVIATNAGAIPEVVADEKCGLLFEAENSAALAKSVIRMLCEPELHEKLSAGAKEQIRHYSSRKSAINTIRLYASLLPRENPAFSYKKHPITANRSIDPSSQSFSYMGSHPRLQTQCGRRDGKQMKSKGVEGFLFYGPYVDLPAGIYKANLYGLVKNTGTPNSFLEVVINSGNDKLAKEILVATQDDSQIASLEFSLSMTAQVEIRVWIPADAEISIRKLIILAEKDFN